jgi:serine/threonine protein kinase/tetratricopeptide (TPR) repeat protein
MNARDEESSRRELRIAAAIDDRTPLDWENELAADPSLAGLMSGLRNVEKIASAHAKITEELVDDFSGFIGTVLLHYRIVEWIGSGSMGAVFRAQDEHLPRQVAIKVVLKKSLADRTLGEILLREARIACSINHPNIATVLDVGENERCVFFVMEFVQGKTLAGLIEEHPLPVSVAVEYGIQIAAAIQAAHDAGVVHRDLKSANICVTKGGLVKVLDFGIAVKASPSAVDGTTAGESTYGPAGMTAGTIAYMAPEMLRGQPADERSDIWALGVTLQEILTGTRPFSGETRTEVERAILRHDPAPLPASIPKPLRKVIARCLKKDPTHRYQHAAEVRAALEVDPVPPPPQPRPWIAALGLAAVVAMAWIIIGHPQAPWSPAPVSPHSILVFPSRNESGVAEQQFLADGLTDQLINTFARLSRVSVKSRTTSYAVAKESKPLPRLAQEHGFDMMLESSVTRTADRVRVNVQLVDARSDRQIWAESYERPLREVLTLDREIARGVAGSLKMHLTDAEQAGLAPAPPVDYPVYQAYVLGRSLKAERRYARAIESYSRATRLDSTFAPAYAGLADCYTEMAYYRELAPAEALSRAAAAATRALQIDSTQGMAHLALAYVHGFQMDWKGAKAELDLAREDEPGSPEVWYGLADYLGAHGLAREEVEAMERAVDLDPLSIRYANELGLAYLNAGRVADAAAQFRRVEKDGRSDEARRAHAYAARCLALQGKSDAAIESLRPPAGSQATPYEEEELAYALARAGKKSEALRVASRLASMGRGIASPLAIAAAQLAAGEREPAFATLSRASADRDPRLIWLGVDQRFDSIRGDPRYTALMRSMGLGPAA